MTGKAGEEGGRGGGGKKIKYVLLFCLESKDLSVFVHTL